MEADKHKVFVLTPVAEACSDDGRELLVLLTTVHLLKVYSELKDNKAADGTYKV